MNLADLSADHANQSASHADHAMMIGVMMSGAMKNANHVILASHVILARELNTNLLLPTWLLMSVVELQISMEILLTHGVC